MCNRYPAWLHVSAVAMMSLFMKTAMDPHKTTVVLHLLHI